MSNNGANPGLGLGTGGGLGDCLPLVATFTLKNTIVANNTPGGDCGNTEVTSEGHNLDSDGTCGLSGPGDQSATDPQLGALRDNGGPTFTRALLPGSPAIDAGEDVGCPATDQRGVPRPQGPACDIGAYEATAPCGNGVLDAGEECDDGNPFDGDCCSSTCRLDPAGTPCGEDGDLCTIDRCDGAGTCVHAARPRNDCRGPAKPQKTNLLIRDALNDKRDLFQWSWTGGRDTSTVDFGDPLTTTGYALCVYDQAGAAQPLLRAAVPGGGTCAGAPCWEALDEGFRYRDPTLALEGIETIDLTGGERTGQSSLLVRARGPVFVPPALPLTPTVTVQLTNAESGVCWDADYSRPATNTQRQFSATAD